jgi:hypothetical protein
MTFMAEIRRRYISLNTNFKGKLYPAIAKLDLPREIQVMIHEEWLLEHLKDLSLIQLKPSEFYFLRPSFLLIRDIVEQLQVYFVSEIVLEKNPMKQFCVFDVFTTDFISFITSRPILFNTYLVSNSDE